jgi:SAM-dependent methyltransferase
MSVEEIRNRVGALQWYHRIDLGGGIHTPGRPYEVLWDNIRKVRQNLDYAGKRVLDVASWDGMWAFEAEGLGACDVIASDIALTGLRQFLLCREVLGRRVLPMYGLAVEEIGKLESMGSFDIIQHLGLLYHVEGPTIGLKQCRKVLRDGGSLIMETAIARSAGAKSFSEDDAFAVFNIGGGDPTGCRLYNDRTTWWVPTLKCLEDMLTVCGFKPDMGTCSTIDQAVRLNPNYIVGRACVICKAV